MRVDHVCVIQTILYATCTCQLPFSQNPPWSLTTKLSRTHSAPRLHSTMLLRRVCSFDPHNMTAPEGAAFALLTVWRNFCETTLTAYLSVCSQTHQHDHHHAQRPNHGASVGAVCLLLAACAIRRKKRNARGQASQIARCAHTILLATLLEST